MYDSAFTPFGQTFLVGTTAVQVPTMNNIVNTSYRIRNLLNTAVRFTWYPATQTVAPNLPTAAPAAGAPTLTMSMLPASVETFCLPANCWFQADTVAALEVTAGEGV